MILAAIVVALGQVAASPLQRSTLANGARLSVERVDGAREVVLSLAIGSGPRPEAPETHGHRHLVEHLVAHAVGPGLEAVGASLDAVTTRDAIVYNVRADRSSLPVVWRTLASLVRGPEPTSLDVAREVAAIRQEGALRSGSERAAAMAWSEAFGPAALDPHGPETGWPESPGDWVSEWSAASLTGANVAVAMAGDFDPRMDATRVTEVLASLPSGPGGLPARAALNHAGRGRNSVWLVCQGLGEEAGRADLAMGLALAQRLGAALQASPGPRPWVGVLVSGAPLPALASSDEGRLLERARLLAGAFWRRYGPDLAIRTEARALWDLADRRFDPEGQALAASRLTNEELRAALGRWSVFLEREER